MGVGKVAGGWTLPEKIIDNVGVERKQNLKSRDDALQAIGECFAECSYASRMDLSPSDLTDLRKNISQLENHYDKITFKSHTMSHLIAYVCIYRKLEGKIPSSIDELNNFIAGFRTDYPRLDNGYLTNQDFKEITTNLTKYIQSINKPRYETENKPMPNMSVKGHNLKLVFESFDFRENKSLDKLSARLTEANLRPEFGATCISAIPENLTTGSRVNPNAAMEQIKADIEGHGYFPTFDERYGTKRLVVNLTPEQPLRQYIQKLITIVSSQNFIVNVNNRNKNNIQRQIIENKLKQEIEKNQKAAQNRQEVDRKKEVLGKFLKLLPTKAGFSNGSIIEDIDSDERAYYIALHNEQYSVVEQGLYNSYSKPVYVSRQINVTIKTFRQSQYYLIKDQISGNLQNAQIMLDSALKDKYGLGTNYYLMNQDGKIAILPADFKPDLFSQISIDTLLWETNIR